MCNFTSVAIRGPDAPFVDDGSNFPNFRTLGKKWGY